MRKSSLPFTLCALSLAQAYCTVHPVVFFFFLDYQTANQIFLKFRHNITKEKCYESIFLAFTELLCLWEGISRNDSWDLLTAATSFFI